MVISKDFRFEAAHMLSYYDGPCNNLHGHSYTGCVRITGDTGARTHMVLDFNIIKSIIDKWDHALLISATGIRDDAEEALLKWAITYNKKVVMMPEGKKCTAEDMASIIKEQLEEMLGSDHVISVSLKETATSVAIV